MRKLALLASVGCVGFANAGGLTERGLHDPLSLLSNVPAGPSYIVPGYSPGTDFLNTSNVVFSAIAVSGNGEYWAAKAIVSGANQIIVSGNRANYASFVGFGRTTGPAPVPQGTINVSSVLGSSLDVTNNGRVGFITTASGGTSTYQSAAYYQSGSFTALLGQGSPIPGYPTLTVGSIDSLSFLPNFPNIAGRIAPTGHNGNVLSMSMLFRNNSVVAAVGGTGLHAPFANSTSPTPLPGDPSAPLVMVEPNSFIMSNDGTNHAYQGYIDGISGLGGPDPVVVMDGDVKIRRGMVIPGGGTVNTFWTGRSVSVSNTSFVCFGKFVDNDHFVYGSDGLLAQTGSQILPHLPGYVWQQPSNGKEFTAVAVNNRGEYAIAGFGNSSTDTDCVIVMRGPKNVIAFQEGQYVDMDSDGYLNDQAWTISQIYGDSMVLDDNLNLTFSAQITAIGNPSPTKSGLFSVRLPIPGDADRSGEVDAVDIDYVISQFGSGDPDADIDGSLEVDAVDIDLVIAAFGRTH